MKNRPDARQFIIREALQCLEGQLTHRFVCLIRQARKQAGNLAGQFGAHLFVARMGQIGIGFGESRGIGRHSALGGKRAFLSEKGKDARVGIGILGKRLTQLFAALLNQPQDIVTAQKALRDRFGRSHASLPRLAAIMLRPAP